MTFCLVLLKYSTSASTVHAPNQSMFMQKPKPGTLAALISKEVEIRRVQVPCLLGIVVFTSSCPLKQLRALFLERVPAA
jgi:hypothetical protein